MTAFDEINRRAKAEPGLVKKVGAIILFDISKNGKVEKSWSKCRHWFDERGGGQNTKAHYLHSVTSRCLSVAIDGKQGVIYEGKPKEGAQAQVTITVDDNDFIDLALGKANAPAVCWLTKISLFITIFVVLALC